MREVIGRTIQIVAVLQFLAMGIATSITAGQVDMAIGMLTSIIAGFVLFSIGELVFNPNAWK